jgi:hypothetical protein
MKVTCVVPVGPGHGDVSKEAAHSIASAALPEGFEREVVLVDDGEGLLGRSCARNLGARSSDSEWLFFMDADDLAYAGVFEALAKELRAEPNLGALWGPIMVRRDLVFSTGERITQDERQYHCRGPAISTWDALLSAGVSALTVGMFVRRSVFADVGGWCERIDLAEDHDFSWACVAHSSAWKKGEDPLVIIRRTNAPSGGRRGVDQASMGVLRNLLALRHAAIYEYWKARGPVRWDDEERAGRPWIYGYFGERWREEPYGPASE